MQRWRVYLAQLMPDIRVVKAPALRPYVGLLTFSAASLAIAIGMTLQKYIAFEYHSSSGVVGWLSVNAYPPYGLGILLLFTLCWHSVGYSNTDSWLFGWDGDLLALVC